MTDSSSVNSLNHFERICSIFGTDSNDSKRVILYYNLFEWACKVTNVTFNLCNPLLINSLGNQFLGNNSGPVVYTYLAAIVNIFTALSFITVTPLLEGFNLKVYFLLRSGLLCSSCLILFLLCFNAGSLYFACILVVICKVSQAIANLCFESLLDDITIAVLIANSRFNNTQETIVQPERANEVSRDVIPNISEINSMENIKNSVNNTTQVSHQISARSYMIGYAGMIGYVIATAPILAAVYFTIKPAMIWLVGIIPNTTAGLWYGTFLIIVWRNLLPIVTKELRSNTQNQIQNNNIFPIVTEPFYNENIKRNSDQNEMINEEQKHVDSNVTKFQWDVLQGDVVEMNTKKTTNSSTNNHTNNNSNSNNNGMNKANNNTISGCNVFGSVLHIFKFIFASAWTGVKAQIATIRQLPAFRDLSFFICSFIFLSGASSTAVTVASIIATDVLNASAVFLVAALFLGVVTAIIGLFFYRYLHGQGYLSPKIILVINALIIGTAMVYVLYSKTVIDLFIIAAIAGSQVGSLSAFARSTVSRLTPCTRQSRFFSLYEFSQESTGWIGPLIIASLTVSQGGGGITFARVSVFTCLVELGIGVLLLLFVNIPRGEIYRNEIDEQESSAAKAIVSSSASQVVES